MLIGAMRQAGLSSFRTWGKVRSFAIIDDSANICLLILTPRLFQSASISAVCHEQRPESAWRSGVRGQWQADLGFLG